MENNLLQRPSEFNQKVVWVHNKVLKTFNPRIQQPDGTWREVVWAPQSGSQKAFLECPLFEVLYEGTRGPGKTDGLLMDFAREVGKGWGGDWKGIIFRKTYPELSDIIDKSKKWFPKIWPDAVYNESKSFWSWPTGEKLLFRPFEKSSDYWKYHGHAYPFIGWEELTTHATDENYKSMMSCCRSTRAGMPRKYRATTNPYGVGHNWVKARFRLPIGGHGIYGQVITDSRDKNGDVEPPRVAIRGSIYENRILLTADPDYIQRLKASARNKNELKAWLEGSWDIVAGGMFDDVWNPVYHIIPSIPLSSIPRGWRIDRSYDHGSSKPFSVGWWAESNGEPITIEGKQYGSIKGDLIRIGEWYGFTGEPDEGVRMLSTDIGEGIIDREEDWGIKGRVLPGPADTSIFDEYEPQRSVAGDMRKKGVVWEKADKGPGSRIQGWEQMRKMFKAAIPVKGVGRTEPGIFIMDRCAQFIRTVPVLPRDEKKPDDVDTAVEDHIGDEARYRSRWQRKTIMVKKNA